ncbi:unnamed protein product [Gulo gulo]|uniref:Uncharacterized protein n=1 Tax=Gulo gulo TaxID=48420 RepID=A0A9X9M6I7_GULGU|nr:unnamed protein product [Gulo gulo]
MVREVLPVSHRTQGGSEGPGHLCCVDSRGPENSHNPADSHLLRTWGTLGISGRKRLPWPVHAPLCMYKKKLLQFRENDDGETGSLWVACALSSQRLPPQRCSPAAGAVTPEQASEWRSPSPSGTCPSGAQQHGGPSSLEPHRHGRRSCNLSSNVRRSPSSLTEQG